MPWTSFLLWVALVCQGDWSGRLHGGDSVAAINTSSKHLRPRGQRMAGTFVVVHNLWCCPTALQLSTAAMDRMPFDDTFEF